MYWLYDTIMYGGHNRVIHFTETYKTLIYLTVGIFQDFFLLAILSLILKISSFLKYFMCSKIRLELPISKFSQV